jgi:hypothetical protein
MATTTNYGWTTPDDTALVKDGASAIRTLGSSVDTTTKALNPSTTLGDIEYRSSTANTNTRLGIGTTGQVLTVSGGVPSWATSSSGGMTLISTTTLTTGTTSLTSIPGTYNDLVLILRNAQPAADANIFIRVNSDTGTSYVQQLTYGKVASAAAFNATEIEFPQGPVDASANASFGIMTFLDYTNTTTWKAIDSIFYGERFDSASNILFNRMHSLWNGSASAITAIDIIANGSTWSAGTALLYGVK